MSVNRVVITGNLTRDAETRATPGGTQVMQCGVAVNDRVRKPDGEWGDRANFIDCVMFGDRAQKLAPLLPKGTKVCIAGKLRQSSWEAKDGTKRSKVEVVIDDLEFMSRREDGGQKQRQAPAPDLSIYDDEVPF